MQMKLNPSPALRRGFYLTQGRFHPAVRTNLFEKRRFLRTVFFLEAPPGFEPGHRDFADLCLTTWLWRRTHWIKLRSQFNSVSAVLHPGADYEARTRYLHLGKVALYQMS